MTLANSPQAQSVIVVIHIDDNSMPIVGTRSLTGLPTAIMLRGDPSPVVIGITHVAEHVVEIGSLDRHPDPLESQQTYGLRLS